MASLFASPDIAALVAAFPPPLPTKNQSSLVRSHSGNSLLNSKTVLKRFRTLLETKPSRIKKLDLPHRLGIERTDWLLDCYEDSPPIRWSRSGTSLIPEPEWINIIEDLKSRCQKSLVEIGSFSKEWDVEPFTDRDINNLNDSQNLRFYAFQSKTSDGKTYLASLDFVETTRREVESTISGASDEKLNLSQLFPDLPNILLKRVAEEVATEGHVEFDFYDVVYVPPGFSDAREKKARAEHDAWLQSLLEAFRNDDYVWIDTTRQPPDTDNALELCQRYTGLHTDVETPTILQVDDTNKMIILPSLLDRTLKELKENATNLVSDSRALSTQPLSGEFISSLVPKSLEPVLAELVLKVPSCAEQVTSAIREAVLDKEQKQHERFGVDFRREVFVPAQLYAPGIDSIVDTKLRQSLTEYVATYFKDEVIPPFAKSVREDGVLGNDRSKMREIEKFVERSEQAKDVGEVLAVMEKFAKKTKISLPSEEEQRLVRRHILERKVSKEMPKMPRGSDVLQNLVWILLSAVAEIGPCTHPETTTANGISTASQEQSNLAHPSGGRLTLFMSPGKDTGRMIKQYAAMAPDDAETSKQLALWREKLKSASQTDEDLAGMKLLAEKVVGKMFAGDPLSGE
jgi:hypothetical protein